MRNKDREVNVWKTILASSWAYIISMFIFANSFLYLGELMNASDNIKEICFLATLMLLLCFFFSNTLQVLTFYVYKKNDVKVSNYEKDKKL